MTRGKALDSEPASVGTATLPSQQCEYMIPMWAPAVGEDGETESG